MEPRPVPAGSEEVIDLLTEGRGAPVDGEKTYINWQNDFQDLANEMRTIWFTEGREAFVDHVHDVSRQICAEAFDRQGHDESMIEQRHIDATAVRTLFSADTNIGTRSDFIGGVFGEVRWINQLIEDGYEIVDRDLLTPPVDIEYRQEVDAILDALGCDEPIKMSQQERNGWDVVAIAPNGEVDTFQVKTTSSKPSWKSSKDYDMLVWVDGEDIHVRPGKDEDWRKL